MVPRRILLLGAALWCSSPQLRAEASLIQEPQLRPVLKTISVVGAQELDQPSILAAGRLHVDEPLPSPG